MTTEPEPPDETAGEPPSRSRPADGPGPSAHDDDGLDLARALARSTAGAARTAPRSKKRKPDAGRSSGKRGSGAHPDDRDPQPLDTTLGRLVADHGWEIDLKVHSVFGRWAELVGDEVAAALPARVVRRRPARGAHRLDGLGDPAAAARARPSYAGSTRSSGTAR